MLWSKTRNKLIIDFLHDKTKEALPQHHVFKSPHYFASPQDFAASVSESVNYTKEYKIKAAIWYYGTFANSKTKGCEDDPNLFIDYKVQLYRSLQQGLVGEENSHDLLLGDVIDLRNKLLQNIDIEFNRLTIHEIVQIGDMINVQPCQFVVGDVGDWVNLRIRLEVNHE